MVDTNILVYARVAVSPFHTAAVTKLDDAHLLSLLTAVPCGGKQVHDANIVATMLAHGIAKLLTHNVTDFNRFSAYFTVMPLIP